MRKILKRIAIGLGGVLLIAIIFVVVRLLQFFRVDAQKLDEKLLVLIGGGGNTAALVSPAGVVIVDTKLWIGSTRMRDQLEPYGKVRAIILTHHHGDHTHGNPLFPLGTEVYAAEPVKALMERFDGDFWEDEPAKSLMPNRPFQKQVDVDFGEDTLRLVPLPASHTGGGDSAILFVKRRVVHAGDLVFTGYYPNIDVGSGGSVSGCITATDRILELEFDTVSPGHGPVGKRDDVVAMRAYYVALRDHGRAAAAQGMSLSDAVKNAPPALQGRESVGGFTSLKQNIEAAMGEAKK
jgi:glyoxylase-like metal-dependent hydrolase (beta-lactamase superfamily II)